ncbi:unnamed protein product, partial [Laminaria digitata]
MSTGHGNVDKWPPPASDPPAHSSGEGSDKVAKNKKKKRRRSSSTRGTSGGSAGSLEPNGIAHPQQQHPTTTPASTDAPGGGVPGTASASKGRLSSPVPRSRRNSEDVLGSLKAPGTGGASLPSDTAGSLNHNHGNNDVSFDLHDHHRDNNGDDGQDEGVVIQRDTLSAPDPAHLAAKKGKGKKKKEKKKKEKDGRRRKQSLAISAVGDEDAPATTTATSALAGDSTDLSSGGKTERELARSRRKRRDQEAGDSDEPRSGIPYALPTSGSRVTPFKAQTHRPSLASPKGSRDTPTAPEDRPRDSPNNTGGAVSAAPKETTQARSGGDDGAAIRGGVTAS